MRLLIFAQVLAILFDIVLVTVDWNNMFTLKVVIHPFAYAVKLKMEFIVLNQLLALIKHGLAPSNFPAPDEESPDASAPTIPPRGKHVSFLSSEQTATATGDKAGLEVTDTPQFIGRDMEYDPAVIPTTNNTDPDIILPSNLPVPEVNYPEDPAFSTPRRLMSEPHIPQRSFSDPTPLSVAVRDRNSDEIIAEIERHYLGRFGIDVPRPS
jgi:hypothetical protein